MINNFLTFSFDGDTFPIMAKLQDEGAKVYVCQIEDASVLGVDSWISEKETPETKKRRMSLYNGILKKIPYEEMMTALSRIQNKDDYYVIFGFNSLYKIAEKVLAMGFKYGNFPLEDDFLREKDRQAAKDFVSKNYDRVMVSPVEKIKGVDNVIKFIQESDKMWCVKSDGNFGETIVPDKDDLEMARRQVIGWLNLHRADYEKGELLLEEKIVKPIEFIPEMAFWNGEYLYSQVEIESRMFGGMDHGPQTGGNQNLIIRTDEHDPINDICFPPAARELMKGRIGLSFMDCGLLSDGEDLYFTEFAGNRWGWGGVFTELSMAYQNGKMATNYFNSIIQGQNPLTNLFGASTAVYSIEPDDKFPEMVKQDMPLFMTDKAAKNFYGMQIRKQGDQLMNVGYRKYDDCPMGYVVGRGNTIDQALEIIFESLLKTSYKGLYHRSEEDFKTFKNCTSVVHRYNYLIKSGFISGDIYKKHQD